MRPTEQPAGRPRLVIAAGGAVREGTARAAGIDHEVVLAPGTFVVGHDDGVDLRLPDATISARHLALEVGADRIDLRDLDTRTGTTVDGVPVTTPVHLVDGNRIELGGTTLTFHRDDLRGDAGREGGELGEHPER